MDVDEESFASKRAEILKEIEILDHKFNQQKPARSKHQSRFSKTTSNKCIQTGKQILDAPIKSLSDFLTALEWFDMAYRISKEKGRIRNMCLARQGLGKTYRLLAEFKLKEYILFHGQQ